MTIIPMPASSKIEEKEQIAADLAKWADDLRAIRKEAIAAAYEGARRMGEVLTKAHGVFAGPRGKHVPRVDGKQLSWPVWLQRELRMSESTAANLMNLAHHPQHVGDDEVLKNLPLSVLYLLSAPETPAEAKEEIKKETKGGRRVTHKRAKAIIRAKKRSKNPPPQSEHPPPQPEVSLPPGWTEYNGDYSRDLRDRGYTLKIRCGEAGWHWRFDGGDIDGYAPDLKTAIEHAEAAVVEWRAEQSAAVNSAQTGIKTEHVGNYSVRPAADQTVEQVTIPTGGTTAPSTRQSAQAALRAIKLLADPGVRITEVIDVAKEGGTDPLLLSQIAAVVRDWADDLTIEARRQAGVQKCEAETDTAPGTVH
jgi:hypothetical protein